MEAFLSVLRGVTKEETVQYVLATLVELLAGGRQSRRRAGRRRRPPAPRTQPISSREAGMATGRPPPPRCRRRAVNPSRSKLFHAQSELHLASQPDPYTVFLRCAGGSRAQPRPAGQAGQPHARPCRRRRAGSTSGAGPLAGPPGLPLDARPARPRAAGCCSGRTGSRRRRRASCWPS
jgi:hypothetical protein